MVLAYMPVPINVLAQSVSLNYTSLRVNLYKTKRLQLLATVLPSNTTNKTLRWLSSNMNIATVSTTGLVTFNKKAIF